MAAATHDLLADFPPSVEHAVRVIGQYTDEGYTIQYLRPDVEATVTDDQADRVHDELLLQDLSKDYLHELFDVGELQYTVHQFETATVIRFVQGERSGMVVSIDTDADIPLETVTEICANWL